MNKPWAIVGGTGYDLEDIDNPRSREMECPSCKRFVRFVEKDLVKNLKVFGLSLIGVEDARRVFACPSCNTAIEPPTDAGLARTDPKVAALDRKLSKLKEDAELWERRANLAARSGDDVLAKDALDMVRRAKEQLAQTEREMARLTAWDDEPEDKPVVVARLKSSGALDTEGPSIDKAFSALKSKLSTVASAVGTAAENITAPSESDEPSRSPTLFARGGEAEEEARKKAAIDKAAEDEFAALKARFKPGAAPASPSADGPSADGPSEGAPSMYDTSFEPTDQSRGVGEDFSRSAVSAVELGLGLDYAPAPKASAITSEPEAPKGPPPAPPPVDDDDPVAALKRKLKKPSP